MTHVLTIARRGLMALLVSPAGWVVAALFVLLSSAFGFVVPVLGGRVATMDGVFGVITSFLLPVLIPVITLLVFAEERGEGTLELLVTSPVRDWEVVAGQWLGAFTFYVLLLATTLMYVVLLAVYVPAHLASLDLGLIASTYAGLLVAGSAATAIGALASSLTQNQIVAFFLAVAILLLTWYAGTLLGFLTQPPASRLFEYAGGSNRFQSFGLGLVTLKDTVYFLSLGVAALFLATRLLDSRRWR
ncbi:MAG: ABC transporter permease [Candidatus Dormibacteraceae bacterium]